MFFFFYKNRDHELSFVASTDRQNLQLTIFKSVVEHNVLYVHNGAIFVVTSETVV